MERKRLIQVGVGGWGLTWAGITSTSPDWDVVAYVNPSEQNLRTAARQEQLDESRLYRSLDEALASVEADALLAVVPAGVHSEVTIKALEHGLHVLVEKPLADSLAQGHDMVSAAESAGRMLMVSQNYRYRRAAETVRDIVRQGFLGEVRHVTIDFRRAPHFVRPDVPQGFTGYRLIEDMSVHHFDQARGILAVEAESAFAKSINPPWSWFASDPVLSASFALANGGLMNYSASWVTQGPETTWDGDWRIDCEHGQIEWSRNRVLVRPSEIYYTVFSQGLLERQGAAEATLLEMDLEDRWYVLHEFSRCIDSGHDPETTGRDNLRTVAMTHAVAESVRSGQPVQLEEYGRAVLPVSSGAVA